MRFIKRWMQAYCPHPFERQRFERVIGEGRNTVLAERCDRCGIHRYTPVTPSSEVDYDYED